MLGMNERNDPTETISRRLVASDYLGGLSLTAGVIAGLLGLDAVGNHALGLEYTYPLDYAMVFGSISVAGFATTSLLGSRGK